MKPEILFENESFLVVDKPAGWLSVPGRDGETTNVVSHWVLSHAAQALPLHRLDRFTSGVMAFGKSKDAHREGCLWFETHQVDKTYVFLAHPTPLLPAQRIKTPIDGKSAETFFKRMTVYPRQFFLGEAKPKTGRFHQIRFHAKDAGFPLLGDQAYQGLTHAYDRSLPRVMLHARALNTPIFKVEAPLPDDFKEWIHLLEHEGRSS